MPNKPVNSETIIEKGCYLPDFCNAETNLLMILVLELIAIVLSLASAPVQSSLFIYVALMSVYIQWLGLSSAAILCLLRSRKLLHGKTWGTTLISLLVVMVITAVLASIAFHVNSLMRFDLFEQQTLLTVLLQHEAISLILFGLALRYFYVQYTGRRLIKLQSRSRLQALQARIRPHFLFNSLNTIASLTYDEPERAERAIENLSDLFRASLKAESKVSLEREIELTKDYIDLEKMRLDDRLQVTWQVDAPLQDIELPALTLQPLVENAIYHGIEPMAEGGEVRVDIQQGENLVIQISNPINGSETSSHRDGNKMALKNIHERLQLAFQGQAKIEHVAENDLYRVVIAIPLG